VLSLSCPAFLSFFFGFFFGVFQTFLVRYNFLFSVLNAFFFFISQPCKQLLILLVSFNFSSGVSFHPFFFLIFRFGSRGFFRRNGNHPVRPVIIRP
jgi:hypothetical protein